MYNMKAKIEALGVSADDTSTKFGGRGGLIGALGHGKQGGGTEEISGQCPLADARGMA